MNPPNWSEFRQRGPAAEPDDRFAELCAVVLTTAHGDELLTELRKRTVEQRTPAGAPEAMLRELEAERRFVQALERARDRGLELRTK